MNVQLRYGAFTRTMSIHVDGQPLARVSRLTKYQSLPFETWCKDICNDISDEVNGKYSLSYMGRSCEARILGQLARENVNCIEFISEAPPMSESAIVRLKRLSRLVLSGVECRRFTGNIYVYTDADLVEVENIVSKGIPKLAFCRIALHVLPLSELINHIDNHPAYILLIKSFGTIQFPALTLQKQRMAILNVDNKFIPLNIKNDWCFEEHVSAESSLAILGQYLELWTYSDLLIEAIRHISISENNPNFLQIAALDKQEPMTQVFLPSSIEYGETASIRIQTIPKGGAAGDIRYRISDESVVQYTPQGLKAVGVGEVVVEAYSAGRSVKVASQRITCYRRNRIQAITIATSRIDMLVGDRFAISYEFEPSDADDSSKVKLVSSNGIIAAIDGKYIIARSPGNCTVYVKAERASASCNICVFPRVSSINANVEDIETSIGQVVKLNVETVPAEATLQKFIYTVSPPSLGRYDSGIKGFYAQHCGAGELIISTQDGTVKKSLPVKVNGAKEDATSLWKSMAVMVTILIILYLILKGS